MIDPNVMSHTTRPPSALRFPSITLPGVVAFLIACIAAASSVLISVASTVAATNEEAPTARAAPVVLPPPVEQFDPTPRVLGPISVIGDSVLRGALVSPPNLVDRLAEQGWGPIRALGVPGLSTGHVFRSPELTATFWFDRWKQQGWDPQAVALIIGSNDVGFCAHFDSVCMRNSMRSIIDHIGPSRDIFVPHINHWFKNEWSIPWNRELDVVVAERANVHTWAWDVELANGNYDLSDVVHLSSNSYRRWSLLTAAEITAALGRPTFVGDNVTVPQATAPPARFNGLDPIRLVDTRVDPSRRLASDRDLLRVAIPNSVASNATAVALYVTGARAAAPGHLQVAACGQPRPATSVVNFVTGAARGAPTVVALDATREVCVYSSVAVDVTVDVQGFFAPDVGSGLHPTPPVRLLDTRSTGRSRVVEVPVGSAAAVAINLTAVKALTNGFLTAYSCESERPSVATLNFAAGQPVASSAFIATDGSDSICVFSSAPVDVIVDQTGTFTDDDGLSFVATTPTRMLDTRSGLGGWRPFANDHRPIDVRAAPAGAAAVTGTITLVRPFAQGHLTGFGCAATPATSSVNAAPGAVVANALTIETSAEGRLCVGSSGQAHVVFDLSGWWTSVG